MIPHNRPTIGSEEEEAVTRVLRSGNLANGTEVSSFEKEFSEYMGLKKEHSVAVSNGTSALFLSLWALDANSKKIAFPSYVCSALRHAVGMINGVETIIDSSKNSPNINQYEMKNNSHDIEIVPHMYGIPTKITRNENIPLIEDCCQALGARVNEELVGLQGTTGIFSFFATKVITSGGHGGMIISKEKEIIEKITSSSIGDKCTSFSKMSIAETLPVIDSCQYYCGNDTGWAHLSAGLGLQALCLFMDSPPLAYSSYSKNIRVVVPEGESLESCGHNTRGKDKISFDKVLSEALEMIN